MSEPRGQPNFWWADAHARREARDWQADACAGRESMGFGRRAQENKGLAWEG